MEEVCRSFTQVKMPIQQCNNSQFQVKVLHEKPTVHNYQLDVV